VLLFKAGMKFAKAFFPKRLRVCSLEEID